mmetsp:Transcript_23229/g.29636  ORF Transcript_23229/g.29636 Transcript_23229/m.29636 type:complete len:154 (-) Transcript_23229:7-468(-)
MLRVCAGRGVSSLARISARSYSSTVDKAVSETKDESLNVVDSIVLLSTRDNIEGKVIEREIGLVAGSSVKSRGMLFDIWARIRAMMGGELRSYGELLSSSSSEATRRMMREAEHINADAVVRVRYQVSSTADPLSGAYCYVLCSGTAVQLKEK